MKCIKTKLADGSGTVILGTFMIVGIFAFILMFMEIYQVRENYINTKAATDTIADGTAIFAKDNYSADINDIMARADETKNVISSELGVDTNSIDIDKKDFEDDATVTVSTSNSFNLISTAFGVGPYSISTTSATKYIMWDINAEVAPGPAGTTDTNARLQWLFDGNVPTSDAEMQKWLTTIIVPVTHIDGSKGTMALSVHKKLADEYLGAFEDMASIGFPISIGDTYAYGGWRTMVSSNSTSHHSYGSAIDVNVNSNPMIGYTGTMDDYNPGSDPYSITPVVVAIWKSHGFYWGGEWNTSKDYMHFSFCNH